LQNPSWALRSQLPRQATKKLSIQGPKTGPPPGKYCCPVNYSSRSKIPTRSSVSVLDPVLDSVSVPDPVLDSVSASVPDSVLDSVSVPNPVSDFASVSSPVLASGPSVTSPVPISVSPPVPDSQRTLIPVSDRFAADSTLITFVKDRKDTKQPFAKS